MTTTTDDPPVVSKDYRPMPPDMVGLSEWVLGIPNNNPELARVFEQASEALFDASGDSNCQRDGLYCRQWALVLLAWVILDPDLNALLDCNPRVDVVRAIVHLAQFATDQSVTNYPNTAVAGRQFASEMLPGGDVIVHLANPMGMGYFALPLTAAQLAVAEAAARPPAGVTGQ
jgi:hypothetical protein